MNINQTTKDLLNEIPKFHVKLTNAGKNNNGAQRITINIPKKVIDFYGLEPGMLVEVGVTALEKVEIEKGTQDSYNYEREPEKREEQMDKEISEAKKEFNEIENI